MTDTLPADPVGVLREALVKARSRSVLLGQSDVTGQLNDKYDRDELAAWFDVSKAIEAVEGQNGRLRELLAEVRSTLAVDATLINHPTRAREFMDCVHATHRKIDRALTQEPPNAS